MNSSISWATCDSNRVEVVNVTVVYIRALTIVSTHRTATISVSLKAVTDRRVRHGVYTLLAAGFYFVLFKFTMISRIEYRLHLWILLCDQKHKETHS